ncbi:C4-dicarboxylate transporter/malic acid transport protein-like protein [Saccharata proteae CBS 121410]|uniref:C4-dicarboxylate transporter/malic acid transport protein-like protein n=1 Tax=Saccharata proteae CBS 121410 TaxID=1314787 RepID=A0A9P4M080_9PEZI|nr:C4-dicarboxylate transporter/malic acid transport protein-like protein [Saccharata proteae CBS 121410]
MSWYNPDGSQPSDSLHTGSGIHGETYWPDGRAPTDGTSTSDGIGFINFPRPLSSHPPAIHPYYVEETENSADSRFNTGSTPIDEDEEKKRSSSSPQSFQSVNGRVSLKNRLEHFTWSWFTTTMSTGGLALALAETPHRFDGLITIGKIVYVFNIVLFLIFVGAIVTRFILIPRALKNSLLDGTEGFFFPAFWLSLAVIIGGANLYGVPSTGPWLIVAIRILFWIYAGCTLLVAALLYWFLFDRASGINLSADKMSPTWVFPIFPAMLTGTIASFIAPSQPPAQRLPIIVAGVAYQGLGWMTAVCIIAIYMYRLFHSGLTPLNVRPGMFMMVGAPAFTIVALIGNANALPAHHAYFAAHPLAAEVLRIMTLFVGIFLWLFAFWLFCIAALSCVAGIPEMGFSLTWWALVFPNVGFTIATVEIGRALGSEAVLWVGSAMTVLLVCAWFFVAGAHVRAVVLGKILWPGRDEDRDEEHNKRD